MRRPRWPQVGQRRRVRAQRGGTRLVEKGGRHSRRRRLARVFASVVQGFKRSRPPSGTPRNNGGLGDRRSIGGAGVWRRHRAALLLHRRQGTAGGLQGLCRRWRRRQVVRRVRRRRQGRVWLLRRRVPERHVVLYVRVQVVRKLLQGRGQELGPCDGRAVRERHGKRRRRRHTREGGPGAAAQGGAGGAECRVRVPRRAEGGPDQQRLPRLAEQLVRRLRLPQQILLRLQLVGDGPHRHGAGVGAAGGFSSGAASPGRSVAAGGKGGAGGAVFARRWCACPVAGAHAVAAHRAAHARTCARAHV